MMPMKGILTELYSYIHIQTHMHAQRTHTLTHNYTSPLREKGSEETNNRPLVRKEV